jgi:uncharacterized damage-inducible protein DinB
MEVHDSSAIWHGTGMARPNSSTWHADALADRLTAAGDALIKVIEGVDDADWRRLPRADVWSPSKDAEHVADANLRHQWIVRLTIGAAKASQRVEIERRQLTSDRTRAEVVALVRRTLAEASALIRGLTDAQLDLATRPARTRAPSLRETIAGMIDHIDHHRAEIEAKVGRPRAR